MYISKCAKCGFQAQVPDGNRIFLCPVPTCQYKSCRLCGEEAHGPLPCDQVEKSNETSARLKVEEAMSQARIRTCPQCSRKFYKQDGCNKMTCSCGTWICYICRQVIPKSVGYNHFCRTPLCRHGKACNMCPLHSTGEQDTEMREVREAGLKAVATIEKSAENNHNQPIAWKTDVDQLLKGGLKKK